MRKKGVLATVALLTGLLFAFSSCDQSTSTELEDSFDVIQEVSAISGAQNASMNLSNNSSNSSAFIVDFNNIEPNNLINNGQKEAWCIEWGVPVNNGSQEGVKLYSTRGQDGWQELNYFLTIKDQLKKQDPDLTWKEIQVVIWSLVQYKPFDVDEIPTYDNFDKQFYENGEYKFDVQKAKNVISLVKSSFSNNKSKLSETSLSVYAVVVENDGQVVIVEGEETFWAFGDFTEEVYKDEELDCFRKSPSQWGWLYELDLTQDFSGELPYTPLVAGAGQSDCTETLTDIENGNVGTVVGNVTFDYDDTSEMVELILTANSDILFDVVHIDVDCSVYDLSDRIINNGGNVAPGLFPISWSDDENGEYTQEVTISFSLDEFAGTSCGTDPSDLYFAIHGVSVPNTL